MGATSSATAAHPSPHGPESPPVNPLTLGRLLQERLLRDSVVLTGSAHLDAPLEWCRSLRDVLADETSLAGVVVVGDEHGAGREVVRVLADRGAVGLLVREWSRERWEEGQTPHGFPVVGIPVQASGDAVSRQVARLSLAYESHVLQYAQVVHSSLASLLHRGAGVNALTDMVERMSDCAVAVVDPQLQLRAFAEGPHTWLDPTTIGSACREMLHALIEERGDTGMAPVGHEPVVLQHIIKGRPVTCVIGDIEMADRQEGWIVLLDEKDPPRDHDIAEHRVVVQQASTIIGTELLRVRSVERAEERARGNFVHALLHGRFSNHADLVARAAHHDFPVQGRFGAVVVQARGLIAEDDSPNRLANMAREASRIQGTAERRTMAAVVGDVIAVVRQVAASGRSGADPGARELHAFAAALAKRLQSQTDRTVLVSYGRPVDGAGAIGESYREARIALGLASQLGLAAPSGFSDLRVHSTLLGLAHDQAGRSFAAELLTPLRAAAGDLDDAVRTYVEAGGNLNQAARDLSVHRNTMLYKLERASKAINWDVREPEAQFAVWLALKLDMLANTADVVNRDLDSG